jgi:hypothetical protein
MKDELIRLRAFIPEDLDLNRHKQLSDRQRRSLQLYFGLQGGFALFEIALTLGYLYLEILYLRNGIVALAIVGLLLSFAYMSVEAALPYWRDLQSGEVRMATGLPKKTFSHRPSGKWAYAGTCSIEVNGQAFVVNPAVYDILSEDDTCRLYYVPNSRSLLNIEPL